MKQFPKNFIFLSQLIGIPVIDLNTNKRIGRVQDIVASLREMYPRASAVILRAPGGERFYLPWQYVRKLIEDRAVFVEGSPELPLLEPKPRENEILLRDTFWDKQIVDISGSKVVRVNDLHLLKENLNLWLVHVDIGMTGLFRRLGWERAADFFFRLLFSTHPKDRLISWKFVQPVTPDIGAEALSLKVPHSKLSELHPADLADIFLDLGTEARVAILRSLDTATAAHMFQELPLRLRVQIAESMALDQLVALINEMAMDEVVDLVSELPRKKVNSLFAKLPREKVDQIAHLLEHSNRVAGSLMNTEFVSVKPSSTVADALAVMRGEARKKESIYYMYVVSDDGILVGVFTLRQLFTMPPERAVSEFMRRRLARVREDTNVKDVAEIFYKYDFTVVPVVDRQNRLQGIITMKDAFEAVFREIKEEAEEPA